MFRRIILFFTLFSITLATITPAANGGCGSRRCSPRSSYRPIVRYSQPVVRYTTVRPAVRVHQPVVHPPTVVVAPRPMKRQLPTVPAGSTITLPANFLGSQLGDAFMVFNKIKLPIKVERWTPTGVTIKLPPMAIKSAVEIRVDIVLPNGKLGVTRQLRVTKPASVVLHPTAPKSPLPTQNAIQQQIELQPQPVTTQPVAIAPNMQTPIQPQVGHPIILPTAPDMSEKSIETNPILQEHLTEPGVDVELEKPQEQPDPSVSTGRPVEAISKLIGG